MKNLKLNNIYKLSDSTININFTYNDKEIDFFLNKDNISKIKKCLNTNKISKALDNLKKYTNEKLTNLKKKVISENKLKDFLEANSIKYSFIGQYLINVEIGNINYLLDFYNNNIDNYSLIDSYDNTEKTIESDNLNSDSDNLINKIKVLNKNFPTDMEGLLNFSLNNKQLLKPVLQVLNSNTDNFLGNIFENFGIDYNLKNNINIDKETSNISKCLKVIEELNNNDISLLKANDFPKFNYLVTQIWNQIKQIVVILNKMNSDNDQGFLSKLKDKINEIGFQDEKDKNILKKVAELYVSSIIDVLVNYNFNLMDSKFLELNIILQSENIESKKELIRDKLLKILKNNSLLYKDFFKNYFTEDEIFNVFSQFNKLIKFNVVLNSLEKKSISQLIILINELTNECLTNISVSQSKINLESIFKFNEETIVPEFIKDINYEINLRNYYNQHQKLICLVEPDFNCFEKNIIFIYNENILNYKKKELSTLLLKFHEEIQFRLSIIKKVI